MNKYYQLLDKVLLTGKQQENKKGRIHYLLNQQLSLTPADLLDIFEGHSIARKKLRKELELFTSGERLTERYREAQLVGLLRTDSRELISDLSGKTSWSYSQNQ